MLEKSIFSVKCYFHKLRRKLYLLWIRLRMKSSLKRDKLARGLVDNCTSCGPLTEEEKNQKRLNQLLGDTSDPTATLKHFELLSKESDPLKDTTKIPDGSVKRVWGFYSQLDNIEYHERTGK